MKFKIALIFAFFLSLQFATAQEDFMLGAEFDEKSYSEKDQVTCDFGARGEELPFDISLKSYMPPVATQGPCPTCMSWSVGYYMMTMMKAKENDWTPEEIKENAFSSHYIFNQVKTSCLRGLPYSKVLNLIEKDGNVKSANFDDPKCDCDRMPDVRMKIRAKMNRIEGSYRVFGRDDSPKTKLFNTKKLLSEGLPVAAGMALRRNFQKIEGEYWKPEEGDNRPWGGHAMTVVGYDDRKQAFELANTWGMNWGNDGFIWVKYDDFLEFCVEAYVLVDREEEVEEDEEEDKDGEEAVVIQDSVQVEEVKPVNLRGRFAFRTPVFGDDTISFDYQKAIHEGGYIYSLEKKDWEISDQFQLEIKGMQKGRYVYVFSLDDEGVNVHWPRNNDLDGKYSMGESPIIPFEKVKIVIPNEERVLTRRSNGDDNICIIYADEEIEDFRKRVNTVLATEGEFTDRFAAGFGDVSIPAEDIDFNNKDMFFSTSSKSGKTVVPMILKVQGNN